MTHHLSTNRNPKINLPVSEILTLLDQGHRQADIAVRFGTSQSAISRIYRRTRLHTTTKKKSHNGPVCSCCGGRSVAKGHHFLCRQCWKYGDTRSPSFTEHTVAA